MVNKIDEEIYRLEQEKRLELLKREVFELALENEALGATTSKQENLSLVERYNDFYDMCSMIYHLKVESGWTMQKIAEELKLSLPVVRGAWLYANKYAIK
jgi:hypothetical protein